MTKTEIKKAAKELKTKGYRVIADGKHTTPKRINTLMRELSTIRGKYDVYRNYNKELTFNFDIE